MTNEFHNIVYFMMSLPYTNYSGRLSYYIVMGLLNTWGVALFFNFQFKIEIAKTKYEIESKYENNEDQKKKVFTQI